MNTIYSYIMNNCISYIKKERNQKNREYNSVIIIIITKKKKNI